MNLNIAILDALADDFESIEQIEKYLLFLGCETQVDKIQKIIQTLLDQGLIYINQSLSDGIHTGMV